ncbi:MAG: hypothetical protein R3B13_38660 [Polyangiaceae bacterium]
MRLTTLSGAARSALCCGALLRLAACHPSAEPKPTPPAPPLAAEPRYPPPSAPREAAPPPAGLSPESALPMATLGRLASGSPVAVVELPGSGIFTARWHFPLGTADEGATRGASEWVAQCLTERARASKQLDALGAKFVVTSDIGALRVALQARADDVDALLKIMPTLLASPSASELERARAAAVATARRRASSAAVAARAALLRELFDLPTARHPHANLLAPPDALQHAPAKDVALLARQALGASNARVVIAGDVRAHAISQPTSDAPAPWPTRGAPSPLPASEARIVLVDLPGSVRATSLCGALGRPSTDPRATIARAAWFAVEPPPPPSATWAGQRFRVGPELLAFAGETEPAALGSWAASCLRHNSPHSAEWESVRARARDASLLSLDSAAGVAESYGALVEAGLGEAHYEAERTQARDAGDAALAAALTVDLAPARRVLAVAADAGAVSAALQALGPVVIVDPARDLAVVRRLPRLVAARAE